MGVYRNIGMSSLPDLCPLNKQVIWQASTSLGRSGRLMSPVVQVEAAQEAAARAREEAGELQAQLELQAVLNAQLVAQVEDHAAELAKVNLPLQGFRGLEHASSHNSVRARLIGRGM